MNKLGTIEKHKLLDELNNQIRTCERCTLSVTRKHALTGEGNIDARIMFVALSPGEKEISIIQPEVIVPLGYYATRAIIGKYHTNPSVLNMSFKSITGRLLFSDKIKVFPLIHPSALLYNPSFEPDTANKYMKLKRSL